MTTAKISTSSILGTTSPILDRLGGWDVTTTYNTDELVSYNGLVYKSLQNTNLGNTPDSSPAYWILLENNIVTDAVLHIYIDTVSGDDANDGTSGNPVQTLERAVELTPAYNSSLVKYYLKGTLTLTKDLPYYFANKSFVNSFIFEASVGDEFTIVDSGTMTSNDYFTHTDSTKTWTVDEYSNKFLRDTTSGEIFPIAGNDGTTLRCGGSFTFLDVAITTYEIIELNNTIDFDSNYLSYAESYIGKISFLKLNLLNIRAYSPSSGSSLSFHDCNITTHSDFQPTDLNKTLFQKCVIYDNNSTAYTKLGLVSFSAIKSNRSNGISSINSSIVESLDNTQKAVPAMRLISGMRDVYTKVYIYDNFIKNFAIGYLCHEYGITKDIVLADHYEWSNVDFGFQIHEGINFINDTQFPVYDLNAGSLNTGMLTYDGSTLSTNYFDLEKSVNALLLDTTSQKHNDISVVNPVRFTDITPSADIEGDFWYDNGTLNFTNNYRTTQIGDAITEDITFYVDGSAGDDSNDGLTWGTAKKTLGFLNSNDANALPRNIDAEVTIQCRNDIYGQNALYHTRINNFYGSGSINIIGEITDVQTGIAVTGQDNTSTSTRYHCYLAASGESWTPGEHRGRFIVITSGTGSGATYYPILNNTADQLESVNLPDTDGTSVINIVSMTKLIDAQESAPGTPITYLVTFYKIENNFIYINTKNIDFSNVTNITSRPSVERNNQQKEIDFTNCAFKSMFISRSASQVFECVYILSGYAYITISDGSFLRLDQSGVYSSDSTGYGIYVDGQSQIDLYYVRFLDLIIAEMIGVNCKVKYLGTNFYDTLTLAHNYINSDIDYGMSSTHKYESCTTAIDIGGSRITVFSNTTIHSNAVTNEILLSDIGKTATFTELLNQEAIYNTATGGFINYVNASTFFTIKPHSNLNIVDATTLYNTTVNDDVILCDGTFTVNLYAVSGNDKKKLFIKNIGTGTITIDPNASETIDDDTSITLTDQYESVTLLCNGTAWYII